MPGILPHLLAGCTLLIIGRYYYRSYFEVENKTNKLLLLAVVCLLFSFIPDFFLAIHLTTHIFSRSVVMPYQEFTHVILIPIAIVALLILYILNPKSKPIWIMGFWAIILHIVMDFFIHTRSLLI